MKLKLLNCSPVIFPDLTAKMLSSTDVPEFPSVELPNFSAINFYNSSSQNDILCVGREKTCNTGNRALGICFEVHYHF